MRKRPILAHTQFAVITNGTLLDERRILKLHDLGVAVSISIDGFTEEANEMRVDKAGRPAYARVIEVLEMYAKLDVPAPSLSVTLSEKTIDDLPHMIELVRKYRVRGFGYNVLLSKGDEEKSDSYYRKASQFIIDRSWLCEVMGFMKTESCVSSMLSHRPGFTFQIVGRPLEARFFLRQMEELAFARD